MPSGPAAAAHAERMSKAMGKVFGYPEFDSTGEMILTTYDNDYKAMMMDIRVYRMKAGETRSFLREGEETAVLLLSGRITYAWDGKTETVSRKDVLVRPCQRRTPDPGDGGGGFGDSGAVHEERKIL